MQPSDPQSTGFLMSAPINGEVSLKTPSPFSITWRLSFGVRPKQTRSTLFEGGAGVCPGWHAASEASRWATAAPAGQPTASAATSTSRARRARTGPGRTERPDELRIDPIHRIHPTILGPLPLGPVRAAPPSADLTRSGGGKSIRRTATPRLAGPEEHRRG